mgnify:CR=1 FL=1
MANIFIMSGLPFSGKSTLSKKIAERLDIPRISFDDAKRLSKPIVDIGEIDKMLSGFYEKIV